MFWGDGSPVSDSELEGIRLANVKHEIVDPGQKGDLLLLDNHLAKHGRLQYDQRILRELGVLLGKPVVRGPEIEPGVSSSSFQKPN